MCEQIKLLPNGPEPTVAMDAKQFREFSDRFQAELKPALDELALARLRSEEDARHHYVW